VCQENKVGNLFLPSCTNHNHKIFALASNESLHKHDNLECRGNSQRPLEKRKVETFGKLKNTMMKETMCDKGCADLCEGRHGRGVYWGGLCHPDSHTVA
jgi:hypothetical protein